MLGADVANRGEIVLVHSLRSRRALLLAGGCCSSLIAFSLPAAAWAQSPTEVPPVTTDAVPTPGDPNTPQPEAAPGPNTDTTSQGPADNGAIVVTGIRAGLRNSINIK